MLRMFGVVLVCVAGICSQNTLASSSKVSDKPRACSAKAICLSGEVVKGEEFRQAINDKLEFVLEPASDTGSGWNIRILPRHETSTCGEFAGIVNTPYRYHSALNIDSSYGISAEEEVSSSPRKFSFVTNCKDYRAEFDRLQIVLWPYSFSEQEVNKARAKLGTSPLGTGQLWITESKISHGLDSPENHLGKIESMRFTVEIRLPGLKEDHPAEIVRR
jgi:hypothetical protein